MEELGHVATVNYSYFSEDIKIVFVDSGKSGAEIHFPPHLYSIAKPSQFHP